uniref:Uncharacterized protein n=1 Tax=Arundo donax TaxID=35708 RepID=A0A0A9F3C1_ARUDO
MLCLNINIVHANREPAKANYL